MNNNLIGWIESFEFAEQQHIKNYTFVPITSSQPDGFNCITLKRALEYKVVEISELEDGASVPEVKVYNKSDKPLILFDGEHIIGAKQNRIINKTVIVDPFSEIVIPVSCTEEGRWHHNSDNFSKSDCNASLYMRKATKLNQDSQSAVWENVACLMNSTKAYSSTSSLNDIYEEIRPLIHDAKGNIKRLPYQIGVIIYKNGVIEALDIINDPKLFSDLYDNLINSYLLDCYENIAEVKSSENKITPNTDLMQFIKESNFNKGDSIGVENRFSLKSDDKVGEFVSFRDKPIHLALFTY